MRFSSKPKVISTEDLMEEVNLGGDKAKPATDRSFQQN